MQENCIVVSVDSERECRLKDSNLGECRIRVKGLWQHIRFRNYYLGVSALGTKWPCNPAHDLCPQWNLPVIVYLKVHKGPRVAPVVHGIVHQTRMLLCRSSLACRVQVGLGCYGILEVTEIVAFEGEQFEQGDPEVGGVALDPAGVQLRNEIDEELAEAGVVLCQI